MIIVFILINIHSLNPKARSCMLYIKTECDFKKLPTLTTFIIKII